MDIGVVPTKYGLCAIGLRSSLGEDRDRAVIRTPVPLPDDVLCQIRGELWEQLAEYLFKVRYWSLAVGLVTFFWALAGVVCLWYSRLWKYDLSMIFLYGWVRLWFLGDGIWKHLQWWAKIPHRRRVRRMRRWLGAVPKIEEPLHWPTLDWGVPVRDEFTEQEYIEFMQGMYPELVPYYAQLLVQDPPQVFDEQPGTILGRVRNILAGPPIRLPRLICYVGEVRFEG